MAESNLHKLSKRGQSVWIDSLSRTMLESGELKRLMKEDAVVGVTTNPTIFQKAISSGEAYDEQLKELLGEEADPKEIFLQLSARDVEAALDLLAKVHEENPQDGFVSWEVDPTLAYDREGTFDEAMRLHKWLDRPNLYVKIPATKPGLGAIEDSIAHEKSINVTLIFSLQRYKEVVEAYLCGLERLVASGGNPSKVHSVASFFVSRVDTEADKRLEAIGSKEALALRGKLAIANAKLAYEHYQHEFSSKRWEVPRRQGRNAAALPLGVDLHEEPGVPRRHVRGGADRARHGEHDAARDHRGVSRSRRSARRHRDREGRRGPQASRRHRQGRSRL